MQFFEFFVGSFGLLRVVSNIDRVDVEGVELNLFGRPVRGVTLYGGFNVTDSEIKRTRRGPYTVGNESPYTPKYTVNLGAQFEAALAPALTGFVRAPTTASRDIPGSTPCRTRRGRRCSPA